jgi:hypothetical protein
MAGVPQQLMLLLIGIAVIATLLPRLVPLGFVRMLPLISSTVSLMWAADEYMFLSSWLPTAYHEQAQALLPLWFATWGRMANWVLFSSFPISLGAAIANVTTSRATSGASGALMWYYAGLFFTSAHFFYGPKALGLLAAIRKPAPAGNPTASLSQWITMHLTRVVTADAPAFLAFATAVLTSIQVIA